MLDATRLPWFAVVLAAAACGKSSSGDPSAKPAAGSSTANAALEARLHAGIECLNRHSANVFEVQKNYLTDLQDAIRQYNLLVDNYNH